jgi:hypothetical protein
MNFKYFMVIMIVMTVFILPSSAVNLTYPDEYYRLGNMTSGFFAKSINMNEIPTWSAQATIATAVELRIQNILLEKQNELLAEQNELMKIQINQTIICDETVSGGRQYTCQPMKLYKN